MTDKKMTSAQRSAIGQVEGNLAISAGAGSGKTTVLAHRFAQALSGAAEAPWAPAEIDQVLTITFTKKAAGEIAERVRRVVNSEVSTASGRRVAEAWISTFHTFCGRIVRRHLLEAGVEPGFTQLDDVGATTIGAHAFEMSCGPLYVSDPDVRRLVDGWGATGLRTAIVAAHENARSMGLNPADAVVPNDIEALAEIIALTTRAAAVYLTELETTDQKAPVVRCSAAVQEWHEAVCACPLDDDLCAQVSLHEGLGQTKGTPDTEARAAYKEARELLSAAIAAVADPRLTSALQRLLRAYASQYASIKAQRSALDFDDLQERAVSLLTSHPEVAEQYRARFRMIMVDEFQDTNDLQMRVLRPLLDDNLCIVGDERQSIYGFRYADVKVFERVRAELANTVELAENFRSHREVMAVINGAFSQTHLFGPEFMQLGSGRTGSWKLDLPTGTPRVECLLVEHDECTIDVARQAEAEAIAARIKELLSQDGLLGRDVAILLRAASQAPVYARALERQGVPVLVSAWMRLFDARETTEVLSLLRAIAVPVDDEALLEVLGGRFVAMSDDGLFAIREATPRHQPLWSGLTAIALGEGGDFPLDSTDRAAAVHAHGVLEYFGREQGRFGIADLLHRACEALDYDLTLFAQGSEGVRAWANVLKIARVADLFETAGSGDLAAFVAYLLDRQENAKDRSAAAEAGDDAVRIMTVHSAKGLEFPVVFVADLARCKRRTSDQLLVGRTVLDGREVPMVGMNPPTGFGPFRTPAHILMAPALEAAAVEEEKRCLYVAATRAEELLVLSGAAKLGKPAAGGANLIDWVRQALGDPDASGVVTVGDSPVSVTVVQPQEAEPTDVDNAVVHTAPPFATPELADRVVDAPLLRPAEVSYSALHLHERCSLSYRAKHALRIGRFEDPSELSPTGLGSAVHAVLESAGANGATDAAIESAARRFGLDAEQQVRLERAVAVFSASEVSRRMHAGDRLRREEPLRVQLGETVLVGNIDAIAWDGRAAYVVDYKTGKGPDEADSQRLTAYELQARCYALAAFECGAEMVEVAFCFVEHDAVTVDYAFTRDGDHRAIRDDIEARIARITTGATAHLARYDANVCSSCPAVGGLCPIDAPPSRRKEASG